MIVYLQDSERRRRNLPLQGRSPSRSPPRSGGGGRRSRSPDRRSPDGRSPVRRSRSKSRSQERRRSRSRSRSRERRRGSRSRSRDRMWVRPAAACMQTLSHALLPSNSGSRFERCNASTPQSALRCPHAQHACPLLPPTRAAHLLAFPYPCIRRRSPSRDRHRRSRSRSRSRGRSGYGHDYGSRRRPSPRPMCVPATVAAVGWA